MALENDSCCRKSPSRLPELTDPHASYAFDPQASGPWKSATVVAEKKPKMQGDASTSSCRVVSTTARPGMVDQPSQKAANLLSQDQVAT